jgi:hypothetical protein
MDFDKARDEQLKYRQALGSSTEAMVSMSKFSGKVTAGEIMDKRRSSAAKLYQSQTGKTTFGEAFVQTEQGKGLYDAASKSVVATGSNKEAAAQLKSQLATQVLSGAITVDQAKSIATNVADKMGDIGLGIQLRGELTELLGSGGEDLMKDPLKVMVKLQEESRKRVSGSMDLAGKQGKKMGWLGATKAGQATTIGGTTAAGAGIGAAIGTAILPGVGSLIGAGIGAIAGAVGGFFSQKSNNKKMGAYAGAAVGDMKNALEQQKQMEDALSVHYTQMIERARLEGNITEQKRLQVEYDEKRNKLAEGGKLLNEQILTSYKNAGPAQEAILNAMKKQLTTKYKGTDQEIYVDAANQTVTDAQAMGNITKEQQALLTIKMNAGELDPQQVVALGSLLTGEKKTSEAVMSIMTKFGSTTGNSMAMVAGLFLNPDGTVNAGAQGKFIAKVDAQPTTADAEKYINFMLELGKMGGVLGGEFVMSYYMDDKNGGVKKELDAIIAGVNDAKDEDITVNLAYKLNPELKQTGDELGDAFDEEYFDKLKTAEEKRTYIKTISAITKIEAGAVIESPSKMMGNRVIAMVALED